MPSEISPNRKTKDSVFTKLFSDKENVLQLYKELHPEDTDVTVDDIIIQTLESILSHTIYNDLGFIAKRYFVLLFEAQSQWNDNMTLRMLFYLSETYRRYLDMTSQSEHYPKRVNLPMPELYVVYTGDKKNVPDEISFNQDYFGGKSPVDLKVKILTETNATIYGQYIGFCKVFDEQYKLYDDKLRCVDETIRICIEKGYLVEFFKKHRSEVISMMEELFDEQRIRESYERAAREIERQSTEKSRAEGKAEGRAERDNELIAKWKARGMTDAEIQNLLA